MLAVPDVTAAAEYYRDQLGCSIRLIWGEPPFYAIVDRGEVTINFILTDSATGDDGDKGGAYIIVDDVDALHAELVDRLLLAGCGEETVNANINAMPKITSRIL